MQDKINKINSVSSDLVYLREEYQRDALYGSRDGDVKFDSFMEWLGNNSHTVEHMIKVAKTIQEI